MDLTDIGQAQIDYIDYRAGLQTGDSITYRVQRGQNQPLRIVLVWTDYPGSLIAAKKLVNDLDLVVTDPIGQRIYANRLPQPDRTNTTESVDVNTPVDGWYTIGVIGISVPFGPQPFALVVNGGANFALAPPPPGSTPTSTPTVTATPTPSLTPLPGLDQYEPNDIAETAYGPITPGVAYSGYIYPPSDVDLFWFVANGGQTINVRLSQIPVGTDYDLYLYDQTGALVALSERAGNSDETISYIPSSTGAMYLAVRSYYGGSQEQAYRLVVDFQAGLTATPTATPTVTSTSSPTMTLTRTATPSATPTPTSGPVNVNRQLNIGWTLVQIPGGGGGELKASDLQSLANAQNLDLRQIARWFGGRWVVYASGSSSSDFPINGAEGVFVRSASSGTLRLLSEASPAAQAVTIGIGWTLIGADERWPSYDSSTLLAALRSQAIQANAVVSWENGRWKVYLAGAETVSFTIRSGGGYFIRSASVGTWQP